MQALDWNPQGKRQQGRPWITWKCTTEAEVKAIKLTWEEAKIASRDFQRWKAVMALCSVWNGEASVSQICY